MVLFGYQSYTMVVSGAPHLIKRDLGQTAEGIGDTQAQAVFNIFIRFAYSHVLLARMNDNSMLVVIYSCVCLFKLIPNVPFREIIYFIIIII